MDYLLFFTQNGCAPCEVAKPGTQVAADTLGVAWIEHNISNSDGISAFEQYASGITNATPFVVYLHNGTAIWNSSMGGISSDAIIDGVNGQIAAAEVLEDTENYTEDPCDDPLFSFFYPDDCEEQPQGENSENNDPINNSDKPKNTTNWRLIGFVIGLIIIILLAYYFIKKQKQ